MQPNKQINIFKSKIICWIATVIKVSVYLSSGNLIQITLSQNLSEGLVGPQARRRLSRCVLMGTRRTWPTGHSLGVQLGRAALNETAGSKGRKCVARWRKSYRKETKYKGKLNKKETWKINSLESKYCGWLTPPAQGAEAWRLFPPNFRHFAWGQRLKNNITINVNIYVFFLFCFTLTTSLKRSYLHVHGIDEENSRHKDSFSGLPWQSSG